MENVFALLVGLQIKHFAADYLLQNAWMITGKRSLLALGGYAHAGIHVLGTALVLTFFGLPLTFVLAILAAEFVIHYGLDFAKAHYGDGISSIEQPRKFWAANGLDQLFHHLTYIGIVYFVATIGP
ncbi:MAG: DUF3307 domain-containing protein [Pseudomonadota bacterium]